MSKLLLHPGVRNVGVGNTITEEEITWYRTFPQAITELEGMKSFKNQNKSDVILPLPRLRIWRLQRGLCWKLPPRWTGGFTLLNSWSCGIFPRAKVTPLFIFGGTRIRLLVATVWRTKWWRFFVVALLSPSTTSHLC